MERIDNDWLFLNPWQDDEDAFERDGIKVRLPHCPKQIPLHDASPDDYEGIYGYQKTFMAEESWQKQRVFVQFDGAAHIADVYCNGKPVGHHACGYTAFRIELTDVLHYGSENTLTVKLDATENPSVPPFGFVIDYLTYGGIYRDVWLDVRAKTYLKDIYCATPDLTSMDALVQIDGNTQDMELSLSLRNDKDEEIFAKKAPAGNGHFRYEDLPVKPWDLDHPNLYTAVFSLIKGEDIIDTKCISVGFRTVHFDSDSFYLNGEKVFLRGLNRHQCWPYLGYGGTASLQKEDARILKEELGCNAVRTSHYPQSQDFVDACDRLGLLVFTEIPGWQHIGDEKWKQQAITNTEDMVVQYRNHPSIFLWGVRINESQDDDDFYQRTNAAAHALDPYRPTSGVRYLQNSSLLEDVYAFNDFSHDGSDAGCRKKKDVTKHADHALLISEANGHMFPTKAFDPQSKREEQALRHARVLNDAKADHQHAGVFQWCMFDYATHKDFGSGDRICYHGVMDAFRNPKTAAWLYASQQDDHPVLALSSSMDIGDYPAGRIDHVYAFTNCDSVRLYQNDVFVKEFKPTEYEALEHPPIRIDDFIGDLLKQEHFAPKQEELIHDCLLAAQHNGYDHLPAHIKAKLVWVMMRYHMSFQDGVKLFSKYVGGWGGSTVVWRADGIRDGKAVIRVKRAPGTKLHLHTTVSANTLYEGDVYDMASVRIQLMDACDDIASYIQLPIALSTEGPLEIVGPHLATLEGGMSGTYVKTTGQTGNAKLRIVCEQCEPVEINFTICEKGN